MSKVFTKKEWVDLLQRELIKAPEHDGEHLHEYFTKDELVITVVTKNKNRRNYTFGGPIWSAMVDFSSQEFLKIFFMSPLRKPYNIKWYKVKEISFVYLSA